MAISASAAFAISGCGSSAPKTVDPVARAADVTAAVPGYRIAATMSVSTPSGPATTQLSGVYNRSDRTGQLTAAESVAGRRMSFTEVFSALTFYLHAVGFPELTQITGGKPWLKFDMSRLLGAMGLGSLPTGTDPSQFVDYLRAVSTSTKRVGMTTVRGIATTHYHATIDLTRYPKMVPRSQRATAARGISTLESALGSHTMPIEAWIDHHNLVRRMRLQFPECVASQRLSVGMTMDLYDYGPQPSTAVPRAADAYDVTPLLTSTLAKVKFGCGSPS